VVGFGALVRASRAGNEAEYGTGRSPIEDHRGPDEASPIRRWGLPEPGTHRQQRAGEGGGRFALDRFRVLQQQVPGAHEVQGALPRCRPACRRAETTERRILSAHPVRPPARRGWRRGRTQVGERRCSIVRHRLPNTCEIFSTPRPPVFPVVSPRRCDCSASRNRTLRQRVYGPQFAARNLLE